MARRTTARKVQSNRGASSQAMLMATERSNGKTSSQKTEAYFYGNMGDSIERRYSGLDGNPNGGFGGGSDFGQGTMGAGSSWNAQGLGNYFGTGLLNGFGRMFGGAAGGGASGGFTYLKRFSSNAAFNHNIIAQCHMAYLGYGMVRNIVDLYADFATEGIDIEHPDASVRNFYRTWARKIGLDERCHNMFLNLFVSGQTFVHRRWATLDDNAKRAMKRSDASENIGDVLVVRGKSKDTSIEARENGFIEWFLSKKGTEYINEITKADKAVGDTPPSATEEVLPQNKAKQIPWGYTFLNPLQMEMRGRKIRGDSYWVMALDKRDALDVARGLGMRSSQDLGTTEVNIPREFLTRMNAYQGPGSGYAAEITLTKEELSVVQAPGKWDWFDWAVPFVYPCLNALYYKDCLRSMEIRACQSIINAVFLYKLGNLKDGFPAEDEHFERLADMLQMPGSVMNILWNDQITAEVIQPKVEGIFDIDKHKSADHDIMTALGVPEVLTGGGGGGSNFSNAFIAVSTVLERLESYRNQVKAWLMGEMKIIADAMGFQKLPTIRFGRTSLQDEKAYQAFITGLYDRNILSADTVLRELDTDVDTEVAKMKDENELREEGVLEMRGPFIKPDNKDGIPQPPPPPAAPAGIGGAKKKKTPKTPNGRPSGTPTGPTGRQANPRKPKGKGLAKLSQLLELHDQFSEQGRTILTRLEDFVGERYLQTKAKDNPGLKHLKQLKLEERERLEQMIYNVFSHMPAPDGESPLSDDFIINMLRSDAAESIKVDVLNIYTDKVSQYSKSFSKAPTREMRRQFMCSAWTQLAIRKHYNTSI